MKTPYLISRTVPSSDTSVPSTISAAVLSQLLTHYPAEYAVAYSRILIGDLVVKPDRNIRKVEVRRGTEKEMRDV